MTGAPITTHRATHGRFRSSAATHPGMRRARNEDAWLNRPELGLWAVADGAGGHQAGEAASRAAIEALSAIPPGLSGGELLAQLRLRLAGVHTALGRAASELGAHAMMASTIVALVAREAHFACVWAGDSRLYRAQEGAFAQITRDHSLAAETETACAPAERNVVTRALGSGAEEAGIEKITGMLMPGDRFLLCSDGIAKALADDALAPLLALDPFEAAERIVQAALASGAIDNVTAITLACA